jgi:hypothetical protein
LWMVIFEPWPAPNLAQRVTRVTTKNEQD